ncbi:uncharacterized protein LOC144657746 isoform X2 [Oculina patagonica]
MEDRAVKRNVNWLRCDPGPLTEQCDKYFNTHCIRTYLWSGKGRVFCKCNAGHFGRAKFNPGCLSTKVDSEGRPPCYYDHQCPSYSYCNSDDRRCHCKGGLVGNGATCHPAPGRTACSSNNDCKRYSECRVGVGVCFCKDELIGDGTICKSARRHKCTSNKDCHSFAICLTGYCICQLKTSGNGRYCRTGRTYCYHDPCGWNAVCAIDPILPNHKWCQCKVGTDKNGDCVECTKDEHCIRKTTTLEHEEVYGRCKDNKCVCRDELRKTQYGCAPNRTPHKCKDNKDCHVKAKCDDGICICQGNTVGNGKFCRDAKPCDPGWKSCGHGVCLIDPLIPSRTDCKCNKGFFEDFPHGCVECSRNQDCPSYSTCVNRMCKCRAELVKKGKTCQPAPLHKCRNSKDCHSKAKCFYGKCVCQGDTTGNGRNCRDSKPCTAAQSASCGSHSTCLLDPIFPEDPICRCHKGFKMSKDNKCLGTFVDFRAWR